MANNVDPDQTAPPGAVWSGSALFACIILSEALVFKILGHLPNHSSSISFSDTPIVNKMFNSYDKYSK